MAADQELTDFQAFASSGFESFGVPIVNFFNFVADFESRMNSLVGFDDPSNVSRFTDILGESGDGGFAEC